MHTSLSASLPSGWVNAEKLDHILASIGEFHIAAVKRINITFVNNCKVMVDAAARLLSLVNQLAYSNKRVTLIFEEGESGVMGYLDRIGFFDLLHENVETNPTRPSYSGALIYGGLNPNTVEFQEISPLPQRRNSQIPSQLANSLEEACSARSDQSVLGRAAFTVFAELIDNIYEHSATPLNGFATMQVYSNGNNAIVAVSDSGDGLLSTLRPTLPRVLSQLSDSDLIVQLFNRGISRYGEERGCGLKQCAEHALKYHANLNIRLATSNVLLKPAQDGYTSNVAYCTEGLPIIWGTHISFQFRLDR